MWLSLKARVYKRGFSVIKNEASEHHCSLGVRYFRTHHTDVSNNRLTIDHGCYYFDPKIERRSAFITMAIVELKWADIDLCVVALQLTRGTPVCYRGLLDAAEKSRYGSVR